MSAQVPHGPTPQEYPQFLSGHAQYPPALASAETDAYPVVVYPQQGATDYPEPAPYPQPGVPVRAGAKPSGLSQPPHGPPAGPPAGAPQPGAASSPYPTAPPWAPPPTVAEPPAAQPPPLLEHGALLVPYPDEMRKASRAQPPAVWPVAVFTLLFGVLGVISAVRRAADARRGHNSTAPYWITFVVTLVTGGFLSFVLGIVAIQPMIDDFREGYRLDAVQDQVLHDGQLARANITATEAKCHAVGDRRSDGMRDYLCRLTLSDGHTASLTLTADPEGRWSSESNG
jgi:hypothetical protein